jgi:predicted HAD superfamily Cof-like phosphohydrolase
MTNFEKVKEFMQVYGQVIPPEAVFPNNDVLNLRLDLIEEEVGELVVAVDALDMTEVADALADILYVTYGMGAALGIDLDRCMEEVHLSNMSKLGEDGNPIYREDGKVMKGPNYFPPNLKNILDD